MVVITYKSPWPFFIPLDQLIGSTMPLKKLCHWIYCLKKKMELKSRSRSRFQKLILSLIFRVSDFGWIVIWEKMSEDED